MNEGVWRIALPVPRGDLYDYLPVPGTSAPRPGCRIEVPFGRRQLSGVLIGTAAGSEIPAESLRAASRILDERPLLTPAILKLLRFAAGYYHHPLGQVVATALPKLLRQSRPAQLREVPIWALSATGKATDPDSLKRAPRQAQVLRRLVDAPSGLASHAISTEFDAAATCRTMAARGLLEIASADSPVAVDVAPELNPEQQAAMAAIRAQAGQFASFLLDGVTGSGKTEVYLHLAADCVASGRQCLVLIPEISLTPQMVTRFARRIAGRVVALHSGLSDTDRQNAWLHAAQGTAQVVLGTRSAIFTPLKRPGALIVDEEHDGSYKQQDGMRYSARDLAVRRAQLESIPVLLGSATPALETMHNASRGRYQNLRLTKRIGGVPMPHSRIIDLRGRPVDEGLSLELAAAIDTHLRAQGQIFLFLNRRGFAPTLLCHDCGWTALCPRCDVRLVLHRRQAALRCHHCGHDSRKPARCPDCGSDSFVALGHGTERLEDRIRQRWPEAGCIRVDGDTTRRRGALEKALEEARSGRARILIGTQILAKGHDFPALSLCGVVDADQGLFGADFRAPERLAQIMTQVAGRAGRREQRGEVLIQTHQPEHPLLRTLVRGGYAEFVGAALAERAQTGWPPFSHLALIRAECTVATSALALLQEAAASVPLDTTVEVMGPVPAQFERRAGRYRYQLLLRSPQRPALHSCLNHLRAVLEQSTLARQARWSLDIDPLDLD